MAQGQGTSIKQEEPEWTAFELMLESFRKSQCEEQDGHFLQDRIRYRMQESSLGDFLFHLNSRQLQEEHVQRDKLDRVRFDKAGGMKSLSKLKRRNDLCEDVLGLIERLLRSNPTGTITVRGALHNMNVLRLAGSKVQRMDKSLRFSETLRCLILAGCCVQDFPGEFLPRGLMMLEMYCNHLQRLDLLTSLCPPNILYLGLGRNYLTQDVLEPLRKLKFLLHLDLSDNNIENIASVVSVCKSLTSLSSLMLQGNPCSYETNYSHIIASSLPKLFFLDGEVVKTTNNEDGKENASISTLSGTLQISLIRIMSFPQPKNEKINKKKVTHTFRIEVLCPLLIKYITTNKESFAELKPASIKSDKNLTTMIKNDRGSSKSSQRDRNKRKASKSSGKQDSNTEKGKKGKTSGAGQKYKKVVTTNDNTKEGTLQEIFDENLCFLSERKKWSKIMEFSEPTIEIPHCDLMLLRNVFRSKIVVYITHLKTLPPVKASNKTKKKVTKTMDVEENLDKRGGNKEILLSKTVVAKLKIPLHSIVWTEKTLDYSWNHLYPARVVEESTPLKLYLKRPVPGSISASSPYAEADEIAICEQSHSKTVGRAACSQSEFAEDLKYVVKKKQPKSKKGKEQDYSSEILIPKEFTVHVGVGVKRSTCTGGSLSMT